MMSELWPSASMIGEKMTFPYSLNLHFLITKNVKHSLPFLSVNYPFVCVKKLEICRQIDAIEKKNYPMR